MKKDILIKRGTPEWDILFRNPEKRLMAVSYDINNLNEIHFSGELGALEDPKRKRIAIIGSRDIPYHTREYIRRIVEAISAIGSDTGTVPPVIISGLAVGTDTAVHIDCLSYGLPNIAVLPTGTGRIYPSKNTELANKIRTAPGSGLLSQFDDKEAPTSLNFIIRHNTMALMSDAVIVMASKKTGGSLAMARIANQMDIPVYAVPGRPDDTWSAGTNKLIREGLARILTDTEELKNLLV